MKTPFTEEGHMESMIKDELEAAFEAAFPAQVQEAIIRCLFNSYETAYADCAKFQTEEAHDIRPFYRWVQLRDELRTALPAASISFYLRNKCF
jgi:hypothetical protein